MKLRALLEKFTCDWLRKIKSSIKVRLSDRPMTYTFDQALQAFKTEVDIKYPPRAVTIRIVQELGKLRGRVIYVVRDSRRYGGRFRGSGIFGGGRGQGYIPKLVSKVITLMNGKKVYYHAYIKFSDDKYHQMKNDQKETLQRERK